MSARRGFALPLVLGIIVILASICASVALATRRSTNAVANYRDAVIARYEAESGLTVAVANIEDRLSRGAGDRKDYLNHLRSDGNVQIIDIASLVDVNLADQTVLANLFAYFTSRDRAEAAARAVKLRMAQQPLRSVEELRSVDGVPADALRYLTIDGDGYINKMTASDTVRNVAGGGLSDEPTRLLFISSSQAHQLRAVYGIQGNDLVLIRWEETSR